MIKKILLTFLLLLCVFQISQAQEKNSGTDSVKVYKKIETLSKKSKFNSFVYKLLFKSNRKSVQSTNAKKKKINIKKSYTRGEGKIIRNINIETLDPFGYSVDNTIDEPGKGFEKFGNRLHLKTKKWTIRNLLLFKKNEPLDSVIANESERLVRRQRYVRSVVIKPVEIPGSKDSVDISVRVLDSWSLTPNGTLSNSRGNFEITERNFFGLGHEFENDFTKRFDNGQNAYMGRYTINNIRDTYIKATLAYENSLNNYTTKRARIERPFFSPLTRLAGGVYFENKYYIDSLPDNTDVFANQIFKLQKQEYWFGHSFKIFKGRNIDYRATNLVTTIGFKIISVGWQEEQTK